MTGDQLRQVTFACENEGKTKVFYVVDIHDYRLGYCDTVYVVGISQQKHIICSF